MSAEEWVTGWGPSPWGLSHVSGQDAMPVTQSSGVTAVTCSAVCANGCRADTSAEHPPSSQHCIQLRLRHHYLPMKSLGFLGPLSDLFVDSLLYPCQALGTELLFRRTLVFNILVSQERKLRCREEK